MSKRITVPDDHIPIILPTSLANELLALCLILRKPGKRALADRLEETAIRQICGEFALAILEAKEN